MWCLVVDRSRLSSAVGWRRISVQKGLWVCPRWGLPQRQFTPGKLHPRGIGHRHLRHRAVPSAFEAPPTAAERRAGAAGAAMLGDEARGLRASTTCAAAAQGFKLHEDRSKDLSCTFHPPCCPATLGHLCPSNQNNHHHQSQSQAAAATTSFSWYQHNYSCPFDSQCGYWSSSSFSIGQSECDALGLGPAAASASVCCYS